MLCFIVAAIIIAAQYVIKAGGEAVAALDPLQPTVKNSQIISNINPKESLKGKIIVVDAGHGGDDPGASGVNGSVEKKLNLSLAFLLKQQLENKGAEVVMTRSDDSIAGTKDQDWEKRREIITKSGADILVSIHMNKFEDAGVSGPVVLFMPGSDQGKTLAESLQKVLNDELDPETQGTARSEDLQILKYGFQPSALVECGYISNPEEEEKLISEEYQLKTANAICDGVVDFFSNM
jgi:N-acetylmuramoyl-L-alanine amidase